MANTEPTLSEITAVVIDQHEVLVVSPLDDVNSLALNGCAAEDPASWDDIVLVWNRYRFHPENVEFIDSLPIRRTTMDDAIQAMNDSAAWFVLDLVKRRVLTGGKFPLLRLRYEPFDEDGPFVHTTVLPPWWELRQYVSTAVVQENRLTPLSIPDPRRDVMWGTAMTNFFARQMLRTVREGADWVSKDWDGLPCGSYDKTIEVHRDWLMTPHDELGGDIPRDCLHGGKDWINDLSGSQTFRVYQGEKLVPIPVELSTYENAVMGRHEVILYFDACRETIDAGWQWLLANKDRIDDSSTEQRLAAAMNDFLALWLDKPFEGGRPPREIVRCERIRIPLVSDGADHVIDCDCPICEMMASDMFGPSVSGYDGHSLDVDGEFAFSIHPTREAWEKEQADWAEMNAKIEAERIAREESGEGNDTEFDSVWPTGASSDTPIPGDASGHLGMAFLLADLVGWLKTNDAPQTDVNELNTAFREYRNSPPHETEEAADAFKRTLEGLSERHVELVARAADLQSRIDEQLRSATNGNTDTDMDVPF